MSPHDASPSLPIVAFIGGGNMARSLIGGLLQAGASPARVRVAEPVAALRDALAGDFGVQVFPDAAAAATGADVWVLAVKPQVMRDVCQSLAVDFPERSVAVSIAAGITTIQLDTWLGGGRAVVRAMPNTPALISSGVTGLFAFPGVSEAERLGAERILNAVGSTVWVSDESLIDAVTAVSGSGPAYVFLFIEALQQAAMELGFTPRQARQLSIETTLGAARLAAQSEEPASVLRERVTSKGGTTAAALATMGERGVLEGIVAGIKAADARGRELGELLGKE